MEMPITLTAVPRSARLSRDLFVRGTQVRVYRPPRFPHPKRHRRVPLIRLQPILLMLLLLLNLLCLLKPLHHPLPRRRQRRMHPPKHCLLLQLLRALPRNMPPKFTSTAARTTSRIRLQPPQPPVRDRKGITDAVRFPNERSVLPIFGRDRLRSAAAFLSRLTITSHFPLFSRISSITLLTSARLIGSLGRTVPFAIPWISVSPWMICSFAAVSMAAAKGEEERRS